MTCRLVVPQAYFLRQFRFNTLEEVMSTPHLMRAALALSCVALAGKVATILAAPLAAPPRSPVAASPQFTGRTGKTKAAVVVGERPGGGALVSSNQMVTPLGMVRRIEGARPKDMALSPDGNTLAVLAQSRVLLFTAGGALKATIPVKAGPLGIAWMPDSRTLFASGDNGQIYRIAAETGTVETGGDNWKAAGELAAEDAAVQRPRGRAANPQVAGLAVSPDGRRLYAALGIRNAVVVLDLPAGKIIGTVPVGVAPYHLALSPDGGTLFVANRGGRPAKAGEASAPSAGTAVRVDPRTDAALHGSLSFVDTQTLSAREIEAGRQPAGMAVSADGGTLYVANSDEDTVSMVDVRARRIRRTISLRPAQDPNFGQMPTSLALSRDGRVLYVACGGANALAVVALSEPAPAVGSLTPARAATTPAGTATARLLGYIPAGWFPIAAAERNGQLFVASSKGVGSRAPDKAGKFRARGSVGTVQFIASNVWRDLARHTRQVAVNNRWGALELPARRGIAPRPVPERVGEPSLFKRVVYIIKENHTYDTDFGDMPEGNGDPSLCLFGEEVTPNQHALARQWVLLDNTYTSGTNSADGHQWTSSSVANAYTEQNYASNARSYPYDGGDPLAYSPEGFLWNSAVRRGKSVRVYGEFVNKPRVVDKATGKRPTWTQLWQDYKDNTGKFSITADTDNAALKPLLHPNYIGFPSIVSDQWRADQFLADLKKFEASGAMPALSILLLPNNHTSGTQPGMPTPRASVADNDLALGRIVEALTRSRFWKDTLIVCIEDDSQLGLDHVDGHRTLAFCISPYTRRGEVVSEPYNHTSVVRTIGLVLGLPAMNRFDRTATPMTACFTTRADFGPYIHRPTRVPLDEMNPPASALRGEARRLAQASARLDWSDVDRADAAIVARAVWLAQRPGQPFPWRSFKPNKDEDD